jgi:opacity protein-like surface antigen
MSAAGTALAQVAAHEQIISFDMGGGAPFTKAAGNEQDYPLRSVASPGFAGGFQYIYHLTPEVGLGADVYYSAFHNANPSAANGTVFHSSLITYELLQRYVFLPYSKDYNPYFIAGIGGNSVYLNWRQRATGGTSYLNGSYTYASFSAGLGAESNITQQLIMGVEARWRYMGTHAFSMANPPDGPGGSTQLVYGPASELVAAFRLGFRFGSSQKFGTAFVDSARMINTTDAGIKARLESELRSQPNLDISHVTIDVDVGVVTLSGMVNSSREKDVITRVARRIPGADQVIVNLVVSEAALP